MEESTMDTSASGLVASPTPVTTVSFTLNGDPVTVEGATPQLTLNEWIRTQPGLSGTKKMCGEGGCGCCVVAVTRVDPVVQQEATIAINSCLCPLYSVEGWNITTVEGIGSSRTKFHPIQQRIVQYNGSQCGYCTPGFVMNMYSLLRENPKPTMQLVEDYFDGNICRCTGYRSILDAMKSFAVDSNSSKAGCIDIEDLGSPKLSCPLSRKPCTEGDVCRGHRRVQSDPEWYQPSSLSGLAEIIASHRDSKLKLVAGSTGRGIFKAPEEVDIYVDVKGIGDLHKVEVTDSSLTVGGAMTLSNLIGVLMTNRDKSSTFEHLASHLLKVANVPVRNVGTWAGNLMLTHNNDNFPSDVFTIMTAVGATITIGSLASVTWDYTTLSLWDFLSRDMKNSIIVSMEIPFASSDVVFRSFKILPTAQNSYAYLNAAFSVEVDSNTFTVKGKPSLVYGGIDTHAISASKTETYLEGKELRDPNTLKGALESLVKEISPNSPPAAASPEYRKSLATSLFFKFYLSAIGGLVSPEVKSASFPFIRPISKGSQSFSTNPSEYPVTEPRTKLTAILQATGEAEYTTDIPTHPAEAAAAFVLTTQGNAKITGMDFSKAEQMPGCLKIITAADIPDGGENNFLPSPFYSEQELVMATNFSEYAGQPVAIVIADTQWNATRIAEAAAAGVKYEIVGKPILTIQEAITAGSFFDPPGASVLQVGDAKSAIADSSRVIKGEVAMGSQHHFNMETQIAFCIPEEDGYTVYSSSAWPSFTQAAVANILGIPASSVNVSVKRCGGSYGSKISRCNWIAAGTALAAYVTERPVRMHMDIDTTMKMVGKRFPYYATYTIGCTNEGIINGIEATVYDDAGFINTDSSLQLALYHLDNAYHVPNWLVTPKACKTNTPSNTYVRSPGTIPGVFISEAMVNHVAKALSLNVEDVKRKNLYQKGQVTPSGMELKYCNISTLWDQLYQSSDMANRKKRVEEFNQANRWRKRGITMVPLRFGCEWNAAPYSAHVGIYRKDGTVAIAHGGIEVGQGINTKVALFPGFLTASDGKLEGKSENKARQRVAQVAAKTLGIPIELIRIKPTNTLISPNDFTTGGSTTSELCCKGVINACNSLNSRIEPVRQKYPDVGWKELIGKCYDDGLDLVARHYVFEKTDHFVYNSYGVTCTEVEVDILTGETQILRVDILEDCGESINPEIDVGQVEGAFVMGLGNWLTEKIMYDGDTGQQLTHNTWEYNPPCSKDIPIDFRVELLKNAPNPLGVLGSKAVGEPPQCMSCSILFAVKRAIESARSEIGKGGYFPMDGPATVEAIQQACLVDPSHFTF